MSDPAWLDRSEYPFASHWLDLPMGRLHYVDEGQGAPLLMVHGQLTWSFMYRHVIRGLAPRVRCVALDQIGFGLSDKPRRWSYLPEQHADNLGRLIDHLGFERVNLLVHDWGGPIGLGWAAHHPDRVGRVIAMDTWMWSLADVTFGRIFSRVMGNPLGRWSTRRFNLFVSVFMRMALRERWPAVRAAYRGPLSRPRDRQGCALFPKHLLDPWLDDCWERREALRDKEALFVWGERAAFAPALRERLASVFASCRLELQPGVGHYVAEELGSALPRLIDDFLA